MRWTDSTAGRAPQKGCRQIDSYEAQEMLREQGALMVDVREPHEHAAGSIPDARLIPLRQITHAVERLREQGDRPIILSCRSGNRSEMACRFLRESGIDNVYNLSGGVTGWLRADLGWSQRA